MRCKDCSCSSRRAREDRRGAEGAQGIARVRRPLLAVLLLPSLGAAPSAAASRSNTRSTATPKLVACDRAAYRGERAEAQHLLRRALAMSTTTRASRPTRRARAATSGARTRTSRQAVKQYPEDAAVRARWGELFLATHQNDEAVKLFEESLELDEHYAPAKLGLAKVAAGRFDEQGARTRERGDREVAGLRASRRICCLRAPISRTARSTKRTRSSTRRSRSREQQKLPPLEIYALKASADLLARQDRQRLDAARAQARTRAMATSTRSRRISM